MLRTCLFFDRANLLLLKQIYNKGLSGAAFSCSFVDMEKRREPRYQAVSARKRAFALVLNPSTTKRSTEEMTKKSQEAQEVEELKDTLRDIYDRVQESGSTRADMQASLDNIANLCTEQLPELNEDDEDSEDDDEEEDAE
jgi:Mg2+ and Co2+ transporter CorA